MMKGSLVLSLIISVVALSVFLCYFWFLIYPETYYARSKRLKAEGYIFNKTHGLWVQRRYKHIIEDGCLRQTIFSPSYSLMIDRWDIQTVGYYAHYEKEHMIDTFLKADVAEHNCEGNVVYVKRWGK